MNRNSRTTLIRILLLMAMMIVMMSLCGCRTRITNNDEVSGVMYDEDGYMMDNYQMRRDELGLSTAKKPLFTGLGAPADDDSGDYNDDDAQMLEDYDPSMYEEDLNEPEEVPDGPSSGNGSSSQGSGGRVIRRNTGGGSSSSDSYIEVVLEPNGGTCSEESVKVKKGGKYGKLPAATWEDHEFLGWYTKEKGGTKVGENTKVGATKSHFLYAHWKEAEKDILYTVIYTDGVGDETIFEDKKFDNLKAGDATPAFGDNPTRSGYNFLGWNPDLAETIDAASADSSHVITYTAKWDDLYQVWSDTFKKTKDTLDEMDVALIDSDNDCEDLAVSCKGKVNTESKRVIVFTDNMEDAKSQKDNYPEADSVIVVSKEAVKDKDEKKSLYLKLLLLSKMHDLDIGSSKTDLGITAEDDTLVVKAK